MTPKKQNYATEQALDVAESDFTLRHLSHNQWLEMRQIMLADAFAFSSIAVGLGSGGVDRFHGPLNYLLAGQTRLLVNCLENPAYQSEITRQVTLECMRREIDPHTKGGFASLDTIISSGVNVRISRSTGKSEYGKSTLLWIATDNPNLDIGIVSKSSPAAQELCESIGNTVMTPRYRFFFPERIPEGKINEQLTKSFINLGGRTRTTQKTMIAKGLNEQWTMLHFDRLYGDDMVGTESGDASIDDSQRWLAAREGISKPIPLGGTRGMFQGTIYGPGDDHSTLLNDPGVFSIVVPIWTRDVPATLETMYTDGIPTIPEWYDLEACRLKRAKTVSVKSGGEGEISWLQNFEMTAHLDGAMVFSQGMLDAAEFKWVRDQHGTRMLAHPRVQSADEIANKVKKVEITDKITDKNRKDWIIRSPKTDLDLAMGVDQSFSDSAVADRWCIFLVGQGPDGTRYLLDAVAGKGYEHMVEWIPMKWNDWAKPRIIGVDAHAQQAYSLDWMKKDQRFRYLKDCLVGLRDSKWSKAQRIRNYLGAGLRSGTLRLAPDLRLFKEEALRWRPGKEGAGVDDILDAAALGLESLDSYVYDRTLVERQQTQYAASYSKNHDALGLNVAGWDW